ncbi:MAG: TolC family protein, partial [Planctomycetes bacterium]|nr:TolC family protein [Planctomycetota bacterium]
MRHKTFQRISLFAVSMVFIATAPGCSFGRIFKDDLEGIDYVELAGQIQYDEALTDDNETWDTRATREPRTIRRPAPGRYEDLTLDQVIEIGLRKSKVLRDLGGSVLRTPELVKTIHGPAIQETDPRFGVAAALSAFDARLSSSGFFENNDRALNNTFFGGGTRTLKQDFNRYQTQISKRVATGAELILRNNTDYDANNAPGNLFRSAWNTNIEMEVRQPLLQGAGVFFNRIAGPSAAPGLVNGIVIARVNRDISLTQFQIALRDYVSNLENAYWDLYFAYRDLDAKRHARDASLELWKTIRARPTQRGFEADKEAQAREQYFRFQQEVQDALTGRIVDGTRSNNG